MAKKKKSSSNPILAEQMNWLHAGKKLYVEWETSRGFFYGNMQAGRAHSYYLAGTQMVRPWSCAWNGGAPETRRITEVFEDEFSLTAFLMTTCIEPKVWRALARIRDGVSVGFSWESPSGSCRATVTPKGDWIEIQGTEQLFDQLTPTQSYHGRYADDRSLVNELRRMIDT